MQTKRKRETVTYPQSAGNLALADESLGVLQTLKAKTLSSVPNMVRNSTEETSEADALAPATGIIVGVGLSVILWCLIIFVMY